LRRRGDGEVESGIRLKIYLEGRAAEAGRRLEAYATDAVPELYPPPYSTRGRLLFRETAVGGEVVVAASAEARIRDVSPRKEEAPLDFLGREVGGRPKGRGGDTLARGASPKGSPFRKERQRGRRTGQRPT